MAFKSTYLAPQEVLNAINNIDKCIIPYNTLFSSRKKKITIDYAFKAKTHPRPIIFVKDQRFTLNNKIGWDGVSLHLGTSQINILREVAERGLVDHKDIDIILNFITEKTMISTINYKIQDLVNVMGISRSKAIKLINEKNKEIK